MKFTIQQSELKSALDVASKAVNQKGIVPIMGCYLFRIGKASTISATNGEIFITKNIEAKSSTEISIAIYAERLNGLVRSLPEQPLNFEIADNEAHIKCESGTYSLPVEDGTHFPLLDAPVGTSVKATLGAKEFNNLLKSTLFATCGDYSKKTNGLCIDFEPDFLTLTGCLGAVLSTRSLNVNIQDKKRAVINQSSARLLSGIEEPGQLEIALFEKNIHFIYGGTVVSVVLIENIYPDYKGIIPIDYPNSIEIDRMQLLWSIKRVVQFCNKETNTIRITIDNNNFTVTGENKDLNERASEKVAVKFDGEPLEIGMNGNFMIESLTTIKSSTVKIDFESPSKAMLLRNSDESDEKRNLILLMPCLLDR